MLGRLLGAIFILASIAPAGAQEGPLYASRPTQILKLTDLNADGDFLDFAEIAEYAAGLPAGLGAIVNSGDDLYVVDGPTASIYRLRDLNADGDALDFAEVLLYAQLVVQPTPSLVGLALDTEGGLFTLDSASASLYRAADLNADGDALDANEFMQIATGLSSPAAIALRPDGRFLAALNNATTPIRILRDLTADGDYFDFAENISYAEDVPAGSDLVAVDDHLAYFSRTTEGRLMKLHDWTGDDDVLDFAEILPFAEGLPSPARLALEGANGLFVACQNPGGSLYLLRDLNADGDALDFAEAIIVAESLTQVGGLTYVSPPIAACLKGDADGNDAVNTADITPMVNILLGTVVPADPCPADTNSDGQLNGLDVRAFVDIIL
ncbi:MAG TPA: dockerin type I domain-containing protein [Phycisphaerae bacterium]|nr:dockerin type I domain-containing protein [Phycisphaerae bacterium]